MRPSLPLLATYRRIFATRAESLGRARCPHYVALPHCAQRLRLCHCHASAARIQSDAPHLIEQAVQALRQLLAEPATGLRRRCHPAWAARQRSLRRCPPCCSRPPPPACPCLCPRQAGPHSPPGAAASAARTSGTSPGGCTPGSPAPARETPSAAPRARRTSAPRGWSCLAAAGLQPRPVRCDPRCQHCAWVSCVLRPRRYLRPPRGCPRAWGWHLPPQQVMLQGAGLSREAPGTPAHHHPGSWLHPPPPHGPPRWCCWGQQAWAAAWSLPRHPGPRTRHPWRPAWRPAHPPPAR